MTRVGTFSKDFAGWRRESVTISHFSSYDSHGAPTWATGVSTACYITYDKKMIPDSNGQQVVTNAQIYIVGDTSVTALDKITMPDSTTPRILNVTNYYNEVGAVELTVIYT